MRPSGSPQILQRRREQAMRLLQSGLQPVDVARRLGVDRRSVRRWKAAFRKAGSKGIASRHNTGRPARLTAQQRQRLRVVLLGGAREAGFPTDLWTCRRVGCLIRSEFGVGYHVGHVWRLLRSLGFSAQKPQRRAVERDEKRVRNWVSRQWPRIKKKPSK
jgi:transposase